MSDRHQQKPYPLRMPDDLRERLDEIAAANGRSLNAEIVHRLWQTLEETPNRLVPFDMNKLSPGLRDLFEQMEKSTTELRDALKVFDPDRVRTNKKASD